jgi:STE24 endopeptidase
MPYLLIVLAILVAEYLLGVLLDVFNVLHAGQELPVEFHGWYDGERYALSQQYLSDNTRFSVVVETVATPLMLAFVLLGGFNLVDHYARSFGHGEVVTGVIFAFLILLGARVLSLPASLYRTFVIETRYGFNRTTLWTFFGDLVKAGLLAVVLGGPLLAGVLWFFATAGAMAWVYAWLLVVVVQVVVIFVAPVWIMPLFNTFEPLPEGDLRSAIEGYCKAQGFALEGIYTMDGSKRSTKSNAAFTGLGRFRRILLFDTLVANHSTDELLAILAHEMGHYRLRHVPMGIAFSLASSGLMFYLLSLFMGNEGLFAAFGMDRISVYGSLVFFGFLFTPVDGALGVITSALSRRHEYAADRFAVETTGKAEAMVDALKRLSVDNLSNLTPHPWLVALQYSHPPVLQRIRAIARLSGSGK